MKNLTTGSVFKNIVFFSLPYLLSYFLQTLYGMADLYIIGRFETQVAATTAVSIGSQVMHMLTVMLVGLAMGTTVCIGRAIGANDRRSVSSTVGNTVSLFSLVSVVFTVILLFLVKPIISIMATPNEAVSGTIAYLTVCFIGIPFITAYNVISSVFRGMGDSKSPMYFIAVACFVNICLDCLFIGAFKMGPVGAALGTTLSQAVSVAISLVVIRKRKLIVISRKDLNPDRTIIGKLLKIGIPVALQDGFIQIAFIVITIIANNRGLTDSAAVGIVEKVICFVFLVPSSMLSAVSALGAQNIGAGKKDRAIQTLKYACLISVGFGIVVCIIAQLLSEPIVGAFTQDNAVIVSGGKYLRGYIFDCVFAGIQFSFSGYFCACGKSQLSFIHNVISILIARVPGAFFASKMFPDTLLPMGLASAAGSLLSSIICIAAFLLMQKKENQFERKDSRETA